MQQNRIVEDAESVQVDCNGKVKTASVPSDEEQSQVAEKLVGEAHLEAFSSLFSFMAAPKLADAANSASLCNEPDGENGATEKKVSTHEMDNYHLAKSTANPAVVIGTSETHSMLPCGSYPVADQVQPKAKGKSILKNIKRFLRI